MIFVGIDNGTTGAVSIYKDEIMTNTPASKYTKKELSYTKTKQHITRIDVEKLIKVLDVCKGSPTICMLERPMLNPGRFKASISALRALEATLIVLEAIGIPYQYLDSREWQKSLLPKGLEKDELKLASRDIANRRYPYLNVKDGDAVCIAEYCRIINIQGRN